MSKKILKRSLALGALMAFVITGSAFAVELEKYEGTGTVDRLRDVSYDGGGQSITLSRGENSHAIGGQNQTTNLVNFKEIIFDGSYTSGFLANNDKSSITLGAVDDDGNVVNRIGTITQKEGSHVDIFFSPQYGGNITAYVNDIIMNNVGNAIYGQSGANILIDATGNVEFTRSGKNTLVGSCNLNETTINNENKVTINANNIKLTALDGIGLNVSSYVWTTGEPPYDELEGKNRLTLDAKNVIDVDARIAAQVKDGLNVGDAVLDLDAETINLKGKEYGVWAANKGKAEIDATTIDIATTNKDAAAYGVSAEKNSQVDLTGATTITASSTGGNTFSVYAENSKVNITGEATITATGAKGNTFGVYAQNNSNVTFVGDATVNVSSTATENTENVIGVLSKTGSLVEFKDAGDVNITATATGGCTAVGVQVQNNVVGLEEGHAKVNLFADNIYIKCSSATAGLATGLAAISGSELNVEGNLTVDAENGNAIAARGGSLININTQGNNNVVKLTGDIVYDYNEINSGSIIDANINLNLTNKESFLTGKIIKDGSAPDGKNNVTGMTLGLYNGATWNLTGESVVNNATFGVDSVLKIDGATFEESKGVYALNGTSNNDVLTIEKGAKLVVNNIDEKTYNIATGFETISEDKWDVDNLNALMEGKWLEDATKGLQLQVVAKEAEQIAEDLGVSEATGDFLNNIVVDANEVGITENDGSAKGKLVGLANAAAKSNNDVVKAKAAAQAVETVQKMAEAGGNSATAANVVTNVTNVTGQRLSFSGGNAGGNKGGHGVGLLEEGSGAAIWAQYVHGKDSVENMPSEAGASSYEGQYNGIVMGVDFKKVGKFQSGIAFNYGEGDTDSVNTTSPTRSEYDFWGIGYYGNIRNADSNVIFDIGYAKTDSDVTSNVIAEGYAETFEASPETTTWTAGVKVEKLYQNNNVQVVPYTGLRYMSIDPEDYSTKCGAMGYKMERQDIWLLPLGVSIRQEVVNKNGWVVTPKVDLSYIWAFGDTDSTMETNTVFGTDNRPVGYDVMDDGSWMGLVGVEAAMDDWTIGVSYSYQKGDHSESKKWYVDAKYSF